MSTLSTILGPFLALSDVHRLAADPQLALSSAAGAALELLALWMGVVLLAGLVAALPGALGRAGRRTASALTPVLAQRAIAAVVGLAGVAAPATAWAASAPVNLDLPAPGQPAGDVTSRPAATSPTPVVATTPTAPDAHRTTVTVHAGDSLWGLARAGLPAGASDTAVAAAWPQWWELNKAVIGADPGLLLPGQVLQVPGSAA